MTGFDVVVLGSLHLDVMVDAPALPRRGETAVGTGWGFKCGGKGGNQAIEAARQGARTAMVGRVGDDDFGRRLLANLIAAGVDRAAVRVDAGAGSGMSVAIREAAGDYGAVIVSGVNLRLDGSDVAAATERLRPGGVLMLQNEVPDAANVAAAAAASAKGARVILNAAPARELPGPLGAQIEILLVNEIEAEMLAGTADPVEAAGRLAILNRVAIVTAGAAGLAVAGRGQRFELAGHRVQVASTHGAGDAFAGALAARLAKGEPLRDAVAFANAAAAAVVATAEEARGSLGPEAAEALLREAGRA
ncbi:MAG: PfkB family carbohydrate kinase [Geminicoccaceae bacterium]